MIVRADHFVFQAQVPDQVHGPGLGGKKAIGSALDQAAVDLLGLDDAAEPRALLDQCAGDSGFGQVVGGGQAGDSAADDYDGHGKNRISEPPCVSMRTPSNRMLTHGGSAFMAGIRVPSRPPP